MHFPFSWQIYGIVAFFGLLLNQQLGQATHMEMLAMNLTGVGCWMLIAFYMYSIDFFINI
jgi:hypothetical protein